MGMEEEVAEREKDLCSEGARNLPFSFFPVYVKKDTKPRLKPIGSR
jgi:hypothetical protein